jgi:hypothetical protein
MNKSNIGWLFAVIGLSVLLVISLVLGISGYYFSVSFVRAKSDIQVGQSATLEAVAGQASVLSFTFDGAYLPNEKLPQRLQISAKNSEDDLLIRVKSQVFGSAADDGLQFVTDEKFVFDGEYYYLQEALTAGSKVLFCDYIQIPEDSNLSSKEKYILTIVVESVKDSPENRASWNFAG